MVYVANTAEALNALKTDTEKGSDRIKNLLQNSDINNSSLNGQALEFITSVNKLVQLKQSTFKLKQTIQQSIDALIDTANKASDDLFSLENIDTSEQTLLEQAVGTAFRIDDMLFTLKDVITSIPNLNDAPSLDTHKQEVSFLIANISDNLNYLKQQLTSFDSGEFNTQFTQKLTAIEHTLVSPGALYQTQQNVINLSDSIANNYVKTEEKTASLLTELNNIELAAKDTVSHYQSEAEEKLLADKSLLVAIAIVFIVLAVIISQITMRAITNPLAAISKALVRLADGDFSKPVTKVNNDEFGVLSDRLNEVTDKLKTLIADIYQQVEGLEKRVADSEASSNLVSTNAANQIERAVNTKSLAQNVSNSADNVNVQTRQSTDNINQAQEQSDAVLSLATQNREQISSLAMSLDEAVAMMDDLSSHSENIGSILDTIVAISEQTNLLALNAAIEAARAGEQGRGFAVVADEVRLLASRTQSSTKEIAEKIQVLQAGTTRTQHAINTGQQSALNCSERSAQLAKAIDAIEQGLTRLAENSSQIETASDEQNLLAQDIVARMQEVESSAKQNSSEINALSGNIHEISELSHKVNDALSRFKF